MNRISTYQTTGSTGTFNWTCPAGVTVVYFSGTYTPTTVYGQSMVPLQVTPNTTYVITIASGDLNVTTSAPSTFGALLTFKFCRTVYLTWVE